MGFAIAAAGIVFDRVHLAAGVHSGFQSYDKVQTELKCDRLCNTHIINSLANLNSRSWNPLRHQPKARLWILDTNLEASAPDCHF
jgi:hypothetical protein